MTAIYNDIHNTLKHINDKWSGLSLDKTRSYNPGDKVLVDQCNLTIKSGNNRTLTSKYIGPFTVKQKVGSYAYEVETPDWICLHKVIQTSFLKPFQERPEDQLDIDEDEADELFFVVKKIINSRRVWGQVQYRVRWQDFEEEYDIWEPIEHLSDPDVMNLVMLFHREFLRKPVYRTLEDKLWTAKSIVLWLLFEGTVSTT